MTCSRMLAGQKLFSENKLGNGDFNVFSWEWGFLNLEYVNLGAPFNKKRK